MKVLFSSLLCHRDVEIFKFNWFCMRAQLDKGFDFQHLILNDGSLDENDKQSLKKLPGVILEEDPITLYNVPKAVLLGKLECLKRGFEKHKADRVVVFDCDIFYLKNWEADLRKILIDRTVVLRDWGSSIGNSLQQYRELFGVLEDATTPNCNTGIISVLSEDYIKIARTLELHIKTPFQIMEDQGIMLAAFHGNLSYVDGIKCIINNAEYHPQLWSYFVEQRGLHLMGMRTRPDGLKDLVQRSLNSLPNFLSLSQFTPSYKYISWGLLEYEHYNFSLPLQKIPSTCGSNWVNDGLYLHGGSHVIWPLPERCNKFTAKFMCMDTGIPSNIKEVIVNGKPFKLGDDVNIPLNGKLEIRTHDGPGTHLVFLAPKVYIDKSWPDLSLQKP